MINDVFPVVSVLMTSYNRENLISQAIESVLNSDLRNFELIIVDDCSMDKTVNIIKSYAESDDRIRFFINDHNLGDYPNRNKAATYAKGKYLKFVDSDDYIYPHTLSTMVDAMEQFPCAGFGLSDPFDKPFITGPACLTAKDAYEYNYFNSPVFFASPGLAIFTKLFFDQIGGFPEKRMVGDFEMWHKLALICPLVLLPGNLYWRRKHNQQELTDQSKYVIEYEKIKVKYLFSPMSPVVYETAREIISMRTNTVKKIFLRKLFALDFAGALLRLKVYFFYVLHRPGKNTKMDLL